MRDEYGERILRRVEKAVSETLWINPHEMWNRCRKRYLVDARCLVFYIMRDRYALAFDRIACLSGFNRATVIHHCRGIEARIGYSAEYKTQYENAIKRLNEMEKTENN